jgi:hypothetical protein
MDEKSIAEITKAEDKKWAEAISNLIVLTKSNKIEWSPIDPSAVSVFSGRARALSAYEATYSQQKMRIQEDGYPPQDISDSLLAISGFAPRTYVSGNITATKISLRLLDRYGGTTFVFPQVAGLGDLLTAVKAQQANIEGFLDNIKQAVA